MSLSERQKILSKNLYEFEEDLARRKKTIRWKLKHAWLFIKIKLGLI